jgi:predicted AAA+ superfamily ATPase
MIAFEKIFSVYSNNEKSNRVNKFADFSIRKTIVEHSSFKEALKRITELHMRGLDAKVAGGLLITGQTGSGKTTLIEFYKEHFPQHIEPDRTVTPVLLVTTPESPTVKSLAEAILISLGDPAAATETTENKTRRIFKYLKECKVELIIVDEFQHFYDSKKISQARKVTDWLKNLFNIASIPVVLVGLPRSVMVVRMNPQLKRRFSSPFYLKPFGFDTDKEVIEFRGVLKKIHGNLPLECPALHEANLARRFFYASCGLIDYVAKIIDRAVLVAGERKQPELNLKTLSIAFQEEVWRDVPKQLNPFADKAILRPLTKNGEPFEIWDDPKQYVSKSTE